MTDFVAAGRNHLEIVVANTPANHPGQFKELQDARISKGGTEPEHQVSGLLGRVTLRIVR